MERQVQVQGDGSLVVEEVVTMMGHQTQVLVDPPLMAVGVVLEVQALLVLLELLLLHTLDLAVEEVVD